MAMRGWESVGADDLARLRAGGGAAKPAAADRPASGRRASPEAEFQAAVVQLATWAGWKTLHHFDSRRTAPGWPDLVLVRAERMIAAELKVGRNTTTDDQRAWLRALSPVPGVEAVVWRPDAAPRAERWFGLVETLESGEIERRLR